VAESGEQEAGIGVQCCILGGSGWHCLYIDTQQAYCINYKLVYKFVLKDGATKFP